MNEWGAILKLVAEALGVADLTATLRKLQAFECAIYLAQIAGVDLGYRFVSIDGVPHSRELMVDFDLLVHAQSDSLLRLGPVAGSKLKLLHSALTVSVGSFDDWDAWIIVVAQVAMEDQAELIKKESALAPSRPDQGELIERARRSLQGAGIAA